MSTNARKMQPAIRILIVDDHPVVVSGCRAMLSGEAEMEVLSAYSGEQGIAATCVPLSVARGLERSKTTRSGNPLAALNPRTELLRLPGGGKSTAKVARLINVSHKTVASTCRLTKNKLDARSPMDLDRIALEHELA
jgi:DNA-binding NarL/FixJ family response regulator